MQNIIYKIEKLRELKKLSKVDFVTKVGIHRDTLYKLSDESIKISTLLKICEVLEVPISYFFDEKKLKTVSEAPAKYGKVKNISYKMNEIEVLNIDNKSGVLSLILK